MVYHKDLTGGDLHVPTSSIRTQLANIGTETISAAQWGYLAELDQALKKSNSPTYADLTLTGGNLNIGTSELILLTTLGTNTNTQLSLKGKGTKNAWLALYDQDDAEQLWAECYSGIGYIYTVGASPSYLSLQYGGGLGVYVGAESVEGENPTFRVYGFPTGGALKHGFMKIEGTTNDFRFGTADGSFVFQTDEGTNTNTSVRIKGKGTGTTWGYFYDQDNLGTLAMGVESDIGYIWTAHVGGSAGVLDLQAAGASTVGSDVYIGSGSSDARQSVLRIYGFPTGESKKYGQLQIISGPKLAITTDSGEITFVDENLFTSGSIDGGSFKVGGVAGATGSFTSVTVVNGIVTAGT